MLDMPQIDHEKCQGCGNCVAVCHCGAIIIVDGKATIIATQSCGWCTVCEILCPNGALSCPFEIVLEER